MMDILIAIGCITVIVVAILLAVWVVFSVAEIVMENPRNLSEDNIFIFIAKPLKHISKLSLLFHRPSPLQREIMQEEKEIKQLEKQKADMERLDQLRGRKERLWQETEKDYRKSTGPHFKHCPLCDNAFFGDYCDCLEYKKTRAFTPEQTEFMLSGGGETTEEAGENHARATENLRW